MDKTVNIIEHLNKSGGFMDVALGLLFVIVAIVVGVFKQYRLISGYSTMSKKELKKRDLEYVCKYFGLFTGIFGGILMLSPFLFIYLNLNFWFHFWFLFGGTWVFVGFMLLFSHIKKDRIYNKQETGQPTMSANNVLYISKSTLNLTAWIKTVIICFLPCLGLGFFGLNANLFPTKVTLLVLSLVFLVIAVWGFLYTPHRYTVTETCLIIQRYLGNIIIPIRQIHTIRLFNASDRKILYNFKFVKSWRADGVFGYFGVYTTKWGKYHILTRRFNNWTLIVTDAKKYVIAPDDLRLIEVVQEQINKVNSSDIQKYDEPLPDSKNWLSRIVFITILAGTAMMLYLGYREPKITVSSESFSVRFPWGITVPISEIANTDTVQWECMPSIALRTNGISLFGVNRGHFMTKDGEKVRLSVKCGVSPVIRIVEQGGSVYYINRKKANETRQIFKKLNNKQ